MVKSEKARLLSVDVIHPLAGGVGQGRVIRARAEGDLSQRLACEIEFPKISKAVDLSLKSRDFAGSAHTRSRDARDIDPTSVTWRLGMFKRLR